MSDDLIERLRRVEPDAPGERTRWLRNPDGPEAADRIAALEAENERLRAQHPGDMHWLSDDPEFPLECWSTPVVDRWENAGTVFELMAAVSLPHIFVTERVLTVDEHGDPDETEPVWFAKRKDAEACYGETLARARAARG